MQALCTMDSTSFLFVTMQLHRVEDLSVPTIVGEYVCVCVCVCVCVVGRCVGGCVVGRCVGGCECEGTNVCCANHIMTVILLCFFVPQK